MHQDTVWVAESVWERWNFIIVQKKGCMQNALDSMHVFGYVETIICTNKCPVDGFLLN
jgi:hypothetical protein